MMVNNGDIIKDGEDYFSIFCIIRSVVYVKKMLDVNNTPAYKLEEVLKSYRKLEIMKK